MSSISLTLSPFGTAEDMDITVITGTCTTGTSGNSCTPSTMLSALAGGTIAPTQAALNGLFGTGTSNVTLTNYSLSGTNGQSSNLTVNLTGTTGSVDWILVGASTLPYYGDGSCGYQNNNIGIGKSCSPDYFKLNGLTGSIGSSVPEPATFGIGGLRSSRPGIAPTLERSARPAFNSVFRLIVTESRPDLRTGFLFLWLSGCTLPALRRV